MKPGSNVKPPGTAVLLLLCLLCWIEGIQADQFKKFDAYEIHYTTFPSTLVPADVAVNHGIVRSSERIVVNISVLKSDESVSAEISGQVINLLNQMVSLDFKEIKEADAIYYLANHPVDEKDTLRFTISIQPSEHEGNPYRLEFLRQYY